MTMPFSVPLFLNTIAGVALHVVLGVWYLVEKWWLVSAVR